VVVDLTVDGRPHHLDVEPRLTLADALRDRCGATGVHLGCEQGACGACTVLLDGEPVRSCLLFAVQCDGSTVTTVAGIAGGASGAGIAGGAGEGDLHPVQAALARHAGLQCGFCTPGFVVLLADAVDRRQALTDAEVRELVSSNICRCTGYEGILAAAREVLPRPG